MLPHKINIREAQESDIQEIQFIRGSVKENVLSDPSRVTDEDCRVYLTQRGKGWVAEVGRSIIGFAIADLQDSSIWALFIHPEFERRGIGKMLHHTMLDWYFAQGKEWVWLSTDPNTRAEEFYARQGWQSTKVLPNGEVKFEMTVNAWKARGL